MTASGRQPDGPARRQGAAAPEALQVVTFPVGGEEFGLDISVITEAIRPLRITALPHMPPFVEGMINLRGMIIPVVDLRKRFGLPAGGGDPRKTRMIITRGALPGARGRGLLGLVVDGVHEVMQVLRNQIEPAPEAARGQGAGFIAGVAKTGDRLVILIDITRILSRAEQAALGEAGDVHA